MSLTPTLSYMLIRWRCTLRLMSPDVPLASFFFFFVHVHRITRFHLFPSEHSALVTKITSNFRKCQSVPRGEGFAPTISEPHNQAPFIFFFLPASVVSASAVASAGGDQSSETSKKKKPRLSPRVPCHPPRAMPERVWTVKVGGW